MIFDGDSITDNWQAEGKQIWAERYGKLDAFDFGISGDRTEHLLWRLSQGQMNNMHPRLIAIMIGTNNMFTNSEAQIAEGVKAVVDDYRRRCPDATILLQGIFPRGHEATDPVRSKIKTINNIIAGFADGNKIIYRDFGDKFLETDGTLSSDVMPDFLHPNVKGYQIWADAIQPVIDQFFPDKP
ncbi:MAG: GDSL family lipase [Verrucomicrobiaceae bacterium]|nr:MAG: GDSL family lipase [Verrucomicrobiaceae bacterium]